VTTECWLAAECVVSGLQVAVCDLQSCRTCVVTMQTFLVMYACADDKPCQNGRSALVYPMEYKGAVYDTV
jgi:hypothetical protein